MRQLTLAAAATSAAILTLAAGRAQNAQPRQRNVIVFVADGLRHGSVNERDTPALWKIRSEGVHFENSHSLFPTFTTANASAIATGHGLGDTGDFSNAIWLGYATFDTGNFGLAPGSPVPFIESDRIQADLDDHGAGSYLGEETLIDRAAESGYNTAVVGKLGPVAVQTPSTVHAVNGRFPASPRTIMVDDLSGAADGPPLAQPLIARLVAEHIPPEAPTRTNGFGAISAYNNGNAGTFARAGTLAANLVQQQWLTDVTTRAILPMFEADRGKPFALLYWSRDPDGTQHNQGDSLNALYPGINGITAREGIKNADRALAQLLAWLDARPDVKANTDIFVTSDHGFATISRREIDRTGRPTMSEAAKHYYADATGAIDTDKGMLPSGFLAIDLSLDLHLGLFDPDRRAEGSRSPFHRVRLTFDTWEHPTFGNGLLGADILKSDGSDATAIVAANGGSDLIYVPGGIGDTVKEIVSLLLRYDYVGSVFVDDKYGEIPGTLPLSTIGLIGSTTLPRPAIVVAFKVFYFNSTDVLTAVQVADSSLQEGQGMHGGFGRDSTFNNMAAIGPDFKKGFVDPAPVGNADIAPTLAKLMGIELRSKGSLRGRVLEEALAAASSTPSVKSGHLLGPGVNGRQTLLLFQEVGSTRYSDTACIIAPGQTSLVCQ